jgi:hypothetical protein
MAKIDLFESEFSAACVVVWEFSCLSYERRFRIPTDSGKFFQGLTVGHLRALVLSMGSADRLGAFNG